MSECFDLLPESTSCIVLVVSLKQLLYGEEEEINSKLKECWLRSINCERNG